MSKKGTMKKIANFFGLLEPDADPPRLSTKVQVMIIATVALFCEKLSDMAWVGVVSGYMAARLVKGAIEKKNGNHR